MCKYRNCDREIEPSKKGQKKEYCNLSCRKMEQTYRKREKVKLDKKIAYNMEIIKEVMFFREINKK